MGQGTESAGGYEAYYDPVEEGLERGEWQTRDGGSIRVEDMSYGHLVNAIKHAQLRSKCESFSCDSDTWDEWVSVLQCELLGRKKPVAKYTSSAVKKPTRGDKQKMRCHCGAVYEARKADLKRGYGKSCSKQCAAIRRKYNKPAAKKIFEIKD